MATPKLQSHVGMYFQLHDLELFSFQLLDGSQQAVAVVDIRNGNLDRFLGIPALAPRRKAIERLARYWLARMRESK